MPEQDELLVEATTLLERICALLCAPSPAALEACERLLEQVREITERWVNGHAPAAGLPARAEALPQFRKALAKASRLLEGAAEYHAQWVGIVSSMCAGYAPDGAPAARPFPAPHLVAEG